MGHCARILGVVTSWRFFRELLRLQVLRRSSLTVLIASVLRSCRIRLDRTTPRKGVRTRVVTKAFAEGPPAIVRIEHVVRCNDYMKQHGMLTPADAAWGVQATPERLRLLADSTKARVTSGVTYGTVNGDATEVGVTPKFEIEVRDVVMFSVSLKEAGVEKARAEAKRV